MPGPPASTRVPREVLRSAFHTVANYFDEIRREWIVGDRKQLELLASGFGPGTNGYAELMRHEVRASVADLRRKLRDDADFLPLVLRYCDLSLRDSIQRLIRLTDLDAILPNQYGESSERWRQTWPAMDLDGELNELLPKLRAAGDAMMLPNAPMIQPEALALPGKSVAMKSRDIKRMAELVAEKVAGRLGSSDNGRTKHDSNGPIPKPGGWTRKELVDEVKENASFSSTSFDRIRRAAKVEPGERGGKGQHRRFSNAELRKLIAAVSASTVRNRVKIADAWRGLLAE